MIEINIKYIQPDVLLKVYKTFSNSNNKNIFSFFSLILLQTIQFVL